MSLQRKDLRSNASSSLFIILQIGKCCVGCKEQKKLEKSGIHFKIHRLDNSETSLNRLDHSETKQYDGLIQI